MGVMGAGAYGMVLANMIRDKREQKKAEQYQQIRQQTPVYITDKFEFIYQGPQSPLNRPYSPKIWQ